MELFNMSGKLMDTEALDFEHIHYYLPPKFSKDLGWSVLYSVILTLNGYYDNKRIPKVGQRYNNLTREMIKNARWHGGSKDNFPTNFGLFINKDRFCLGCNDGGDYFKRKDIKDIWENKKQLKEYHESENPDIGYHVGYSIFKDVFESINIDTEQGTFYGIINLKNYISKNL